MSHKQAKRLRKEIGYNKAASPAEYKHTTVKTVMVPTGRVNAEGVPEYTPSVRIITECTGIRSAYQQLKKDEKK